MRVFIESKGNYFRVSVMEQEKSQLKSTVIPEATIPLALEATKVRCLFAQYFASSAVGVKSNVVGMIEFSTPVSLAFLLLETSRPRTIFI